MARPRIMIVESQPDFSSLMAAALEPTCDVTPVEDGKAAEDALQQGVFQAVIIDMETPRVDPLALAEHASGLGCGVILIPDLPSQYNDAARVGHLILSKPLRCKRLMELVDQACERASGAGAD